MKPIDIGHHVAPFKPNGNAKPEHIEMFRTLDTQPDNERPLEASLLLLCTPRCGSTFFSEALNACGKLGHCDEWFNYSYMDAWHRVTGADCNLKAYLEWIVKKTLRNTGVLAVKCHMGQLIAMNRDFGSCVEAMDFTHTVYLSRGNKIAQAVSLVKAVSTDQFRSSDEIRGEYQMSRRGIADALKNLVWFDQFADQSLSKYTDKQYTYNDLCSAPHVACNEVLEALGKSPCDPEAFRVTKIKKQSDQRNLNAIEDFRRYILGEVE